MDRAINEYEFINIKPVAIALGPTEYLSFREVEIQKYQQIPDDKPLAHNVELSFRGLPIYSIEIDGIHILGQREQALQTLTLRQLHKLPYMKMGIKGEEQAK